MVFHWLLEKINRKVLDPSTVLYYFLEDVIVIGQTEPLGQV